MRLLSMLLISLLTFGVMASPVETFEFQDNVTKQRFQSLTKELRCPKCQNQDLADSNSPVAADLRKQVYVMLQQGKSDMEIMQYMQDRYGDFVLYRPKVNELTYFLWFGPAIFLFIGAAVVVLILRQRKHSKQAQPLTEAQLKKIQQLTKE